MNHAAVERGVLREDVQFVGLLFIVAVLYTLEFAVGLLPSPLTVATLSSLTFWAATMANVLIGTVASTVITVELNWSRGGTD